MKQWSLNVKNSIVLFLLLFSTNSYAQIMRQVHLDVPTVKQGPALCGPATIEMVFRYWGITEYDQYDIAYNILMFHPQAKRVKQSKILETTKIDWSLYPGTGTGTMRDFLTQYAVTKNHKFKNLSAKPKNAEREKNEIWDIVKGYLSNRIPVIVHQYSRGKGTPGHYRVVTGYDDQHNIVYLNDPNPGKKITQSYHEFFNLWNVDEPWLHYNAIVFNALGSSVTVRLTKYQE